MSELEFTPDEVASFLACFERTASWKDWKRLRERGRDVISVQVSAGKDTTLRLAKTGSALYVASGFDGWGLTVCTSMKELLESVSSDSPAQAA